MLQQLICKPTPSSYQMAPCTLHSCAFNPHVVSEQRCLSCFTSMLGQFVETDGLARTVIAILLVTTLGCFAYTWGYHEVRRLHMHSFVPWQLSNERALLTRSSCRECTTAALSWSTLETPSSSPPHMRGRV